MDHSRDFIHLLGPDISIKIFMHLDDPSDLTRLSSVSTSWRQFVITNGLCKHLCLKRLPEISTVTDFIEAGNMIEPVTVGQSTCFEWESLKRNHRIYAFLAQGLNPFSRKDCISEAIQASSTDNYPNESIENTLEPSDRVEHRASYWSSKGASDPSTPERLVYKLMANLCLVTEIHIHPFQAYFQYGFPIYSSKAVRFRMGYPKYAEVLQPEVADYSVSVDNFIWTYTSPEFPVAQENCLQKFKLPEPVLCIGGIFMVELLGRVQKQDMDDLYYICISHVQVVGKPLLPQFDVEISDSTGKCTLKYFSETDCCIPTTSLLEENTGTSSPFRAITARLVQRGTRGWEQIILSTLLCRQN